MLTEDELTVSAFRAQCFTLMDNLPTSGIVITRRGRPIARLIPIKQSPVELIGSCRSIRIDPKDALFSAGLNWDAAS